MDASELKVGVRLRDARTGRVIVLERHVDPMGKVVGPWWAVRNTDSGLRTLILVHTLTTGRRFSRV